MTAPLVLTGASAVKAARNLAAAQNNRDRWPYTWLFPPPNSEDVFVEHSVPAPVNNQETEVLAYQVPSSYTFVLQALVQMYSGAGFIQGSGTILWTLDLNTPIGNLPIQSDRVQGFQSVDVSLGSNVIPWYLARPRIFKSLDILRSKVITTNAITPGSGNFFTSMFLGYIMPASK